MKSISFIQFRMTNKIIIIDKFRKSNQIINKTDVLKWLKGKTAQSKNG